MDIKKREINESRLLEIAQGLIKLPTVNPPGDEALVAEYLSTLFLNEGFTSSIDWIDKNRANFVTWVEGEKPGPTLVFTGHMDVVNATGEWKKPPFDACIEGTRLYGRGSADMKGAIASMVEAAMTFYENDKLNCGRLMLAFVADEELSNKGTISFLKQYKNLDYAVLGEPTELEIAYAHRGCATFKLTTHGLAGHASEPSIGINAILLMLPIVQAIEKYNEFISKRNYGSLPAPTATVNVIKGGEKFNIIPDRCEIIIDRRLLPSEDLISVKGELIEVIHDAVKASVCKDFSLEMVSFCSPGELSLQSDFLSKSISVFSKCFGTKPHVKEFRASCEQSYFLDQGVETIICGPGSISQAHVVDEYIEISEMSRAAELYLALCEEILIKEE